MESQSTRGPEPSPGKMVAGADLPEPKPQTEQSPEIDLKTRLVDIQEVSDEEEHQDQEL